MIHEVIKEHRHASGHCQRLIGANSAIFTLANGW
jgi:hypothetical protein